MPQFRFEGGVVEFEDGMTVLDSLARAGHAVSSGCKAGACQSCLLRAVGEPPKRGQVGLDATTVKAGGFLSCQGLAREGLDITRFEASFFPSYRAVVQETRYLSGDVLHVRLDAPELGFHPGRFVQVSHVGGVRRPYSIATSAFDDPAIVDLHVRLIPGGQMSSLLQAAMPGDSYSIQGPFGKCAYNPAHLDRTLVLIGSGTGLAPLYAIACDALNQGHRGFVHFYLGSSSPQNLYFREPLEDLGHRFANFRVVLCADHRGGNGVREGSPLEHAVGDLVQFDGASIYLCGHPTLVKAGQRRCFLAGASLKEIFADAFEPHCAT